MINKENYTLITGSTGGLGGAFCKECLKDGQNIIISGTNQTKLDNLKQSLKNVYPNLKILAKECNLALQESRNTLIDFIKDNNININCLINNAGYISEGSFLNYSENDIINTIRVNCEGTINLTQKIISIRDKEQPLNIITVSSLAANYPMPYMAIYAASKAFLKSFFTAIAYELKDENIFITNVYPSGIPTTNAMQEAIRAQGFNGKITMATPEFIAKGALKASKKHKKEYIPKFINRFIRNISRPLSDIQLSKTVGRMWKKSQKKRKIK